jgi:ubiquinone/menaquinone biosynthesis C-methylase UbiE
MKLLHLGCDDAFMSGFDNLDPKINGWTFESGLARYADCSVDGITISHALMYVAEADWSAVLTEFFRVLAPDGVVRITEDDTQTLDSARYEQPYAGAHCNTGPEMARRHLETAGFDVHDCTAYSTTFATAQLLIAHRERVPRFVFYIEGKKNSSHLPAT